MGILRASVTLLAGAVAYISALLVCSAAQAEVPGSQSVNQAVNASSLRSQINSAVLEGRWLIDLQLVQKANVQANANNFLPSWQANNSKRAQIVRLALSEQQFANETIVNADKGYRLLTHIEYQTDAKTQRAAAIWVEQDTDRSRFSATIDFERAIKKFLRNYPEASVSVTAYQGQKRAFTRAFSNAHVCNNCDALSVSTAFELGDVSQAVAGLLAARLEHKQESQQGVPLNLSLNWKTRDLLILMPAQHRHRVVDLMSHTACIPVENSAQTFIGASKRLPAQYYAEQVWNKAMIPGCAPGLLERKSALGFLYLAAFLEAATGRSAAELINEEFTQGFKLPSLVVSPEQSVNVLGSGLRASSVDLGALLAEVLKGQLIPRRAISSRLWKRVSSHNNYSFGWQLGPNGRVYSRDVGLHSQAAVYVERRSGKVLVALLRGKADKIAFQNLHAVLLEAL